MFNSKRRRIKELELEVATMKGISLATDRIIAAVMQQNEQLHDRLIARSLPELKTYTGDDGIPSATRRSLPAEADELNAGEVLDVE